MWGNRVVIPSKLRSRIKEELHRSHPGMSRMKALARSYLWWLGLDKELERCAQECLSCQAVRNSPAAAPLHPWLWPSRPWKRIHVDFAGPFMGKMFLIAVDAHSKWPEVRIMPSTTASNTIAELRQLIAAHGLPQQLVSDNGPQFSSEEFAAFCKGNGVKHIRCAPYHPASNGIAERFVQILKRAMKAGAADTAQPLSQRLANFLFAYRCTPHATTNEAPCQLFLSRKLRTRLDLLRPNYEEHVQKRHAQQKKDHDQHARSMELDEGKRVMVRNFGQGADWVVGVIEKMIGPLSYMVKVGDGKRWKRHIDHIRLIKTPEERNIEEQNETLVVPTSITDMTPTREESDTSQSSDAQEPRDNQESRRYPSRIRRQPDRLMPVDTENT